MHMVSDLPKYRHVKSADKVNTCICPIYISPSLCGSYITESTLCRPYFSHLQGSGSPGLLPGGPVRLVDLPHSPLVMPLQLLLAQTL